MTQEIDIPNVVPLVPDKDVHRLARLGVCLMSISDNSVIVQNGAESSLVVEVREKQESDPIFLKLKGGVNNQRVEVFSQEGEIYFTTKVDCVFQIWES